VVQEHVLGEVGHAEVSASFHEGIGVRVAFIHVDHLPLFPSHRPDDLDVVIGGVGGASLVGAEAELFWFVGPVLLFEVEDVGVEVGVANVGAVEGTGDVLSGGAGTSMYYS
jgi:hypothetical protein